VSPKGLVGAMQFGVVHKDRLNREVLTPLPNCGHFLQEDEPERVGQLIGEFLNITSPKPMIDG
jgi:pimeloyl-ACP methyl ester carboxylesterase